jgi:predicted nucleic-acid-binding protein
MRQLVVENVAHVAAALHLLRTTNADFSDCMIMIATQNAGCIWTIPLAAKRARQA